MYRLLIIFFVLGIYACDTPSSAGVSDQTEETVEAGDQNMSATTPMPAVAMSGDNYEVKVLDGTIKSPRKELTGKVGDADVVINYGSPAMKGRAIYGGLVPYGKVWRTGANEATRITFTGPVEVGEDDTELAAGTYALFTIPQEGDEWTVIFNKVSDQWGAYDYDEGQDVARIEAEVMTVDEPTESMDFMLDGEDVVLVWADRKITFEVEAED